MKFSPFEWKAVTDGKEYKGPKGRLRLRLAAQAALYVKVSKADPETGEVLEKEAVVGFASEFDISMTTAYAFRVVGADGSVFCPDVPLYETSGPIFTNADRKPFENGHTEAITRALRRFQLEQQQVLAEGRRLNAKLASRLKNPDAAPEVSASVDIPPVVEPEGSDVGDDETSSDT